MANSRTRRTLVVSLAAALALSSTGLPVIVVACGMGKMVLVNGCAGSCKADDDHGERLTRVPCGAECGFVERNTTPFITAKSTVTQPFQQLILIVPRFLFQSPVVAYTTTPTSSPPVPPEDIPILVSSLLI